MVHTSNSMMNICFLTYIALPLGGCTQCNNPSVKKSNDEGGVVFRLIPGTLRHSASGTEVTFQFRNDSSRVVQLPGYFGHGPKEGVLQVAYTEYEVQAAGKWERLDVAYDGIPEYYPVELGSELRLLITLGPFEAQKVPGNVPVRVALEKFRSEAFTLDAAIGAKPWRKGEKKKGEQSGDSPRVPKGKKKGHP